MDSKIAKFSKLIDKKNFRNPKVSQVHSIFTWKTLSLANDLSIFQLNLFLPGRGERPGPPPPALPRLKHLS